MTYGRTVPICVPTISLTAALLVLACVPSSSSTTQKGIVSNDSAKIIAGRADFLQYCSGCHGSDAKGEDGPNLHNQSLTVSFTVERIKSGVKDEMPAFTRLSPSQVGELASYVHSLQ